MAIDKVEVPEPVIEVGANDAVAPDGNPAAERLTLPAKPPNAIIEILETALPPAVAEMDAGEAEIEKSGLDTEGASAGTRVLASNDPTPVTKSYGGAAL